MRKLTVFICLIVTLTLSAQTTKIEITFTGVKNVDGVIRIALYNGVDAYRAHEATKTLVVQSEKGEVTCSFDSVPTGKYILAAYHDENEDAKLNKGTFGIPIEGYAFSNNAKAVMGPPDPEKMLFEIKEEKVSVLSMEMQYFDFKIFEQ
ncbi:MAG: DUF2141 domain-containing protein [Bacteroidales bacterium]|nr:DUF2141 domain-containing protein [Bacteroidales bacterium]